MVCDCWWCDIQGALLGDNWLYKSSRRCYPFGTDRWRLQSLRRRMAEAAAAWAAGAVACCGWRESRHGPRLQEGMERAPQRSSGWKSCKVAQPSLYRLRRTCVPACGCRHGEGNPLATGLPVLLLGSHFLLPRIEEIIFGPRCFLGRYLKAQRMSMFSSVSPPSFPPFPLRPSGSACAGAPRPLPGVVAHGRGCVRRQPRPFPSFLSDSSSLPSPSFWGCVCWCSTSFAWSGGPWQRVRATPATSLPFLSDSSSLPSPSFWGCVCWCSTSSAWSGGPWQRVRATPATSLPFLSFWLFLPSLPVLLGVRVLVLHVLCLEWWPMAEGACDASHVPSLPFFLTSSLPPTVLQMESLCCIPRCFFAQQLNA